MPEFEIVVESRAVYRHRESALNMAEALKRAAVVTEGVRRGHVFPTEQFFSKVELTKTADDDEMEPF